MRRIVSHCVLITLLTYGSAAAQSRFSIGAGIVARTSDAGSLSAGHTLAPAAQFGFSLQRLRYDFRLDVGGHIFLGVTEAIADCLPGASCETQQSLSGGTQVTAAIERIAVRRVPAIRWVAGPGIYRVFTSGPGASGHRDATAVGAHAGVVLRFGALSADSRLHLPLSELAEVRRMWITALVVRL